MVTPIKVYIYVGFSSDSLEGRCPLLSETIKRYQATAHVV